MRCSFQASVLRAEYPALFVPAPCGLHTCHAPSAPRMAHSDLHGDLLSRDRGRDAGRHESRRKSKPECSLWAAGARPVRIPARAAAPLLRKDATGFRALSLKPASSLRKAQASLPVPRSHRAPAGPGQKQNPRGGQLRNGLRALGQNRFRSSPPALPRPTGGLFARVPSLMDKAASRSRCALRRSTASVASGDGSLRCRSLGLATASPVTASVSTGVLPSPCSAWGLRITALRPWGACANFRPPQRTKVFCHSLPSLRGDCAHLCTGKHANGLTLRKRMGLRVLALSNPNLNQNLGSSRSKDPSTSTKARSKPDQTSIRSKANVMPLIEIPPQGKEVSITVHLPEETATDVKLYARFIKATHPAAPSAIITECIRRTLKQDTEFQTWKSDPANAKLGRGGSRPKTTPPSHPPQSNKPEAGAKAV